MVEPRTVNAAVAGSSIAISILNAAGEHGIKVFEGILSLTFSRPEYPTAKDHDDADRLYMERLSREAPPEILMVKRESPLFGVV